MEDEIKLRTTPTEELEKLDCLSKETVTNPRIAYVISKKANQLRVQYASATSWAERKARINLATSRRLKVLPKRYHIYTLDYKKKVLEVIDIQFKY